MRLWHKDLIEKLPRLQILGQHREACALRGKGWGKKHSTVDYVFTHPYGCLFHYHKKIMEEMVNRGQKPSKIWLNHKYRGKVLKFDKSIKVDIEYDYPEHNEEYLKECLDNLKVKGIYL